MKHIAFAAAVAVAMLTAACGYIGHHAQRQPLTLTILHINDHHSHLDPESLPLELETAAGRRERLTVSMGGFARVAGAIKDMSAADPNVIKIHAGDALTGDLYATLTDGQADAAMMNSICFDTFTLGNHEFDNGDTGLRRFLDDLAQGPCATRVLSANVRFGPASPLGPAHPPQRVQPSTVLERGGQKIGLVGITTAAKTAQSSRPDPGTVFLNELQSAQSEIDALHRRGIDKIILQTHVGYEMDRQLAMGLHGVDVIVGGDSHTLLGPQALADAGLSPQGPYPTVLRNLDGKAVCVVQAWEYARVVGELQVRFDAWGNVIACSGAPHVLIGGDFRRNGQMLPAAEAAAVRARLPAGALLRVTEPDAGAQAVLAPYARRKARFGHEVVGQVPAPLCLRRVPGRALDAGRSALGARCNGDAHVAAHGGDVQQLVAEAFLMQGRRFFNADFSIQNGGGVRTDLPAGPLTVDAIYAMLPFKNQLVRLEATGAQVKAALEDALDNVAVGRNTGGYPYAAGLRWKVDMRRPKGQRMADMEVLGPDGDYRPLDPGATYRVALIDYLADGHDGYAAFAGITGSHRMDVQLEYAQSFIDYVRSLPGTAKALKRPPTARYSTQSFVDPAR